MKKHVATIFAACVLSLSFASSAKDKPVAETVDTANADYGPRPENYEELVKTWAEQNLKDPESARYNRISKPRKEFMIASLKPFFGWSVCADINAKNSYGGYTGAQTYWFLIRDGKIERSQSTSGFPGKMISRGHNVNCEDGNEEGT